jgi:hypothetical protein
MVPVTCVFFYIPYLRSKSTAGKELPSIWYVGKT